MCPVTVDLTHQLSEGVVLNHGHAANLVESSCHVVITSVNLHVILVRNNKVDHEEVNFVSDECCAA